MDLKKDSFDTTKIEKSLKDLNDRIKKTIDGLGQSIEDLQAKMKAVSATSEVPGQGKSNNAAEFFNQRFDSIAAEMKKASIAQLKDNKSRLENLRKMANESLGGSEQGKGVYQQYALIATKIDDEIRSRKKLGAQLGGFLKRQGINSISITEALTSKAPIVQLGIKYLLDRNKAAKKAEDSSKRSSLLDSIAYRDLLNRQKEKLQNGGLPGKPGKGNGRRRRFSGEGSPEKERKEKLKKNKSTPETHDNPLNEEPETSPNKDNIIDAEFEDLGQVPFGERQSYPDVSAPQLVLASHEMNQEAEAERERNRPVDVTPKDRALREGQNRDFNYPPQQPLFLNEGKFRNRNQKGRFAPGMMEGNYVPKQKGVEIPTPAPLENDATKSLKDLQIIAVKIHDDMGKYHDEETTKTDATLAQEEEKRIATKEQQDELIKTIKLLGTGPTTNNKEKDLNKKGIWDTLKDMLPGAGAGAGAAAGAGAGAGAGAAGAGAAGVAGAAGTLGAGGAALGLAGAAGTVIASGWVANKMADKALDVMGVDQPPFDLYAEALTDNGVKGMEKHWWIPDVVWKTKVWNNFKGLSKAYGGTSWYDEWLKSKHPDEAKKLHAAESPKEKTSEQTPAPGPTPKEKEPPSPKMAGPGAGNAAFVAPSKMGTTGQPNVYQSSSQTPTMVSGSSANAPVSSPPPSMTPSTAPQPSAPVLTTGLVQPGQMKMSTKGIEGIKKHEGFAAKPYPDGFGHQSIGYGHQIQKGEKFTEIDKATATTLLKGDMTKYEKIVNNSVKIPLTQDMADSMIDLAYNLPAAVPKVAAKLNKRDYTGAISTMKSYNKWHNPKTNKVEVLSSLNDRRTEEAAAFSSSQVALLPPAPPSQGKAILATTKDNEDKKAEQSQNKGGGNVVVAPSNTTNNSAAVISQQQDPHNRDNTYRDTRRNNSFSS